MKYINKYRDLKLEKPSDIFEYFIANLSPTINSWDYFVGWKKVVSCYNSVKVEINIINSIIGDENPEKRFLDLCVDYPNIIKAIPILVACRDKTIKIVKSGGIGFDTFDFNKNMSADNALHFMKMTGLFDQILNGFIRSIPDYVFGVEAGLDTNGRKNRSGTSMENIVEGYIKDICIENGYRYLTQASQASINKEFGKNISFVKSNRLIDFAVLANNNLYLIETNYYGTSGSKLNSIANGYRQDNQRWKNDGNKFIWVTDGQGWIDTQKPLREAFDDLDFVFNIKMLSDGLLEAAFRS